MSNALHELNHWARTSPPDEFWLWSIGLVIVALVCFFFAFHYLHRKRMIEDVPTSRIRSAAQGYLELIGSSELMEGQPIIAPLTGSQCTWYQFTVEEKVKRNNREGWKVIRKGISDELFLIRDETGECVIDPEGAHVVVNSKDIWHGNQVTPMRKPLTTGRKWFGTGRNRYRYTEKRLNISEPLYAIGLFKTTGGSGARLNVNEDVRELIREWKLDSEKLLKKFDLDGDGQIDMDEWQKVRDAAYREVEENHKQQKTLPPVHLMSRTRDKRRPYILSAVPEEELTRKFHWLSMLCFSGFIMGGGSSVWLIALRLAT
ncbi:MAG: GIDE domain-containing protein [Gammaproteobacteria bacterium]